MKFEYDGHRIDNKRVNVIKFASYILEQYSVLYCIVLYCIVLYCIMRPYTEGQLDRYRIGIPRELSEIRTQPWLSEGSLTCDPCHHR